MRVWLPARQHLSPAALVSVVDQFGFLTVTVYLSWPARDDHRYPVPRRGTTSLDLFEVPTSTASTSS